VVDELQIHQVPVVFGGGRRLFDVLPVRIEVEVVRVIDTPQATHIRYAVSERKSAGPMAIEKEEKEHCVDRRLMGTDRIRNMKAAAHGGPESYRFR
jgi:hypothetical protein